MRRHEHKNAQVVVRHDSCYSPASKTVHAARASRDSEMNHGHHEHGDEHDGHGMDHIHHSAHDFVGHGSAKMFLRRFLIVTILLIPLALTNETIASFFGFPIVTLKKWVGFAIATIIFSFALIFFKHARHEIQARQYGTRI
ncbi:MAG: hypothetical protein COY99_02555 [Candidatus Yonathbacteria bacterium CG_4_10_14_0_8_um_filter_47_645]|uniref:Heavy metal translocating P-type ATPase n=1 Tax=Candidatus Nomurabacteria bacterium CG1_02_47_685 TaxID=1805282 RepID=A0A1J4VAZ1_9BACT|nr:MAG: hypothetical protein AUJ44_00860 [Candidatus Nomurabacteria bacterium CG1_02_47_685]PIP03528.1 MAG: hypothetical protein COX54_03290 [Candidatus Yonathbacteria bacterium CG23_combo_of_CG06-09_8_20_14_all_46_18]PIY57559.1 MAG: hypothetical protein COY99_02555 [Candidatus Yonathbacteria bacterium CG_4_10_14_0_8_um_filter_47_645]PJC67157.1 MAG: hypothetical protein CO016_02845 [Candidatus Yonathbacteria bacterium CG_4_8_14_3_um_filter_46_25]